MNTRIRELGEQAGMAMADTMLGGWPNEDRIVVEEFARLVVQDAIRVANNCLRFNKEAQEWDYALKFYERELRKHFGVEDGQG